MHALIKSEAYYLTHDPVISHWENRKDVHKQAEKLRIGLQYTGRAYTRIFLLVRRGNVVYVITNRHTFALALDFVLENLENFLAIQSDGKQFQKFLERNSVK